MGQKFLLGLVGWIDVPTAMRKKRQQQVRGMAAGTGRDDDVGNLGETWGKMDAGGGELGERMEKQGTARCRERRCVYACFIGARAHYPDDPSSLQSLSDSMDADGFLVLITVGCERFKIAGEIEVRGFSATSPDVSPCFPALRHSIGIQLLLSDQSQAFSGRCCSCTNNPSRVAWQGQAG